ncbi:MAG TPA: SagB/ThcOx family dehydrogenase [Tahibacter sp.]|nr:SagB/ThcOx family dehydrogenase [Tahibacter sp.]
MSDNLFLREGIGGSAGMLVHEATKNFEKGRRFHQPADGVSVAGSWVRAVYPQAFAETPLSYAADAREAETLSCIDTLFRRRSVRAYAPQPLEFAALARFLALAYPIEVIAPDYEAALQPHQSLSEWNGHVTTCRLLLLARDVEGVEPGVYLVDEQVRALRRVNAIGADALGRLVRSGCFQEEFHSAPAFFLQVGSIHDALLRYGERGYRYLLLENGVLLQRLYLAASALGLAGCVTGSIIQKEFEQALALDGYLGAALNCFALGHMPTLSAAS